MGGKPGLLSILLILSEIVSYRFDDSDLDAIEWHFGRGKKVV